MVKSFFKNHWQGILFNLIVLLIFIFGYGRFGNVIVDSFREAYIPAQMIKGQVLYKNIFNIYAPLSYLINAFLFGIFGAKLWVLYCAGFLATIGIINLTFKISNLFLNKNISLAIVLFIISASVLSPNVFNFIFPYSYGMLYGLLFILGSIYFTIKKQFPTAYFLYALAVCSKYEFILLLPLLIFISGKKDILKNFIALIIPFLLTILLLVIQKAGLENIIASFQIILHMGSAKTLLWFYSVMGLVFRWEIIPIYIFNIGKILIPILLLQKFQTYWLIPVVLIYLYFTLTPEVLIFAFPLILILFAHRFQRLNFNEKVFIVAGMLISMKVFFALTLMAYGVFFIPFALISLFILSPNNYKRTLCIITILSSLIIGGKNIHSLAIKDVKITSPRGTVFADRSYGNSLKELIQYIDKNTSEKDNVVIYPECLIVNFMSGRDSDNKFYSLIPLYVETFGEDIIIGRLDITKPEYVIISNYDTSIYYYSHFAKDYAGRVFSYIQDNYEYQNSIGENLVFTIYKRKN